MSKILNDTIIKKFSCFNYTIIYKTLNIKDDVVSFIIVGSEKYNIYAVEIPLEDFKTIINNILCLIENKTLYYKRFNINGEIEEAPVKIERIKSNNEYFEIVTDLIDNKRIEKIDNAKYTHLLVKMLGISGDTKVIQYIYDHDFLYYSYCILQSYLSNISSIDSEFKDKYNNITIKKFKRKEYEINDFWTNFDNYIIKAFDYIGCDILPIEDRISAVNCELFIMGD